MNPFDGLLPPPTAAPPLPPRGGAATVAAAARDRRRAKARRTVQAAGVLSVALASVVTLRPQPGNHGLTPTTTFPPSPPVESVTPTPTLGGIVGGGGPKPMPTHTVPPSVRPLPTIRPVQPPAWSPPAGTRYTDIDRTFVPDPNPGEDCLVETWTTSPGAVICSRTFAPESVPSGEPADFVYQACAVGGSQTIHFSGATEVDFYIFLRSDGSRRFQSVTPEGPPHDLVIPGGQCAQYTIHWDGLDSDGEPLPEDRYIAAGRLWENGGVNNISQDEFDVT